MTSITISKLEIIPSAIKIKCFHQVDEQQPKTQNAKHNQYDFDSFLPILLGKFPFLAILVIDHKKNDD